MALIELTELRKQLDDLLEKASLGIVLHLGVLLSCLIRKLMVHLDYVDYCKLNQMIVKNK